jgi:hypothetical protein
MRKMPTVLCHFVTHAVVFDKLLFSVAQDCGEDAFDDNLRWQMRLRSVMTLTLILFMFDIGYDDCSRLRF